MRRFRQSAFRTLLLADAILWAGPAAANQLIANGTTTLNFDLQNSFTGRLGTQLQRTAMLGDIWLQPRFTMNFWHGFGGTDTTLFNQTIPLTAPFEANLLDVGGGVAARFTDGINAYVQFKYSLNLDGAYRRAFGGTIGLRQAL